MTALSDEMFSLEPCAVSMGSTRQPDRPVWQQAASAEHGGKRQGRQCQW
jgi:hypothetical protein